MLNATWQRCRVHFLRNALAYANKSQQLDIMFSAFINFALIADGLRLC